MTCFITGLCFLCASAVLPPLATWCRCCFRVHVWLFVHFHSRVTLYFLSPVGRHWTVGRRSTARRAGGSRACAISSAVPRALLALTPIGWWLIPFLFASQLEARTFGMYTCHGAGRLSALWAGRRRLVWEHLNTQPRLLHGVAWVLSGPSWLWLLLSNWRQLYSPALI